MSEQNTVSENAGVNFALANLRDVQKRTADGRALLIESAVKVLESELSSLRQQVADLTAMLQQADFIAFPNDRLIDREFSVDYENGGFEFAGTYGTWQHDMFIAGGFSTILEAFQSLATPLTDKADQTEKL